MTDVANPSCPLCNGHTELQSRESHATLYRSAATATTPSTTIQATVLTGQTPVGHYRTPATSPAGRDGTVSTDTLLRPVSGRQSPAAGCTFRDYE